MHFTPVDGHYSVEASQSSVRKTYPSDLFQAEVGVARILEDISKGGILHAPKIKEVNFSEFQITFERIKYRSSARDLFVEACGPTDKSDRNNYGDVAVPFFKRCGTALAQIHSTKPAEGASSWTPPMASRDLFSLFIPEAILSEKRSQVFLHGDFGFGNVLLGCSGPSEVWIIDPSPNNYSSNAPGEVGHRLLDVAKMTVCLRGTVNPRRALRLDRNLAAGLREAFIRGYEDASDVQIDRDLLQKFEIAIFGAKVRFVNYGSLRTLAMTVFLFGPRAGFAAWRGINAA